MKIKIIMIILMKINQANKNMKSLINKILIVSIFGLLSLGLFTAPSLVLAEGSEYVSTSGNIIFESSPLFGTTDFVPGGSVTKYIKFKNDTDITRRTYINVANIMNTDNLGDAITLTIKQGDTTIYKNTFSKFFKKGKVELPQVKSGETNTIEFIATFAPESGDEYQSKTVSFGLQAVIEDVDESGDTTVIGGVGGATIGHKNLIISNESAIPENNNGNIMNITWNTNIPATSQVVYGLTSDGPYTLDLNDTNFGYPNSTKEIDLNKVVEHLVILDNLQDGQYSYRVVSRASPPTVSYEHYFSVGENKLALNNIKPNNVLLGGNNTEENNDENIINNENGNNNLMAAAGNIMLNPKLWIVLFLIALIILFLLWRRKKNKNKKNK